MRGLRLAVRLIDTVSRHSKSLFCSIATRSHEKALRKQYKPQRYPEGGYHCRISAGSAFTSCLATARCGEPSGKEHNSPMELIKVPRTPKDCQNEVISPVGN